MIGVREQMLMDILSTHSPAHTLLSHALRRDSDLTLLQFSITPWQTELSSSETREFS